MFLPSLSAFMHFSFLSKAFENEYRCETIIPDHIGFNYKKQYILLMLNIPSCSNFVQTVDSSTYTFSW